MHKNLYYQILVRIAQNFDFEVTLATGSFQKDLYNVLCFDYLKRVKSAFLKNIKSNQILKEKIKSYLGIKLVSDLFFGRFIFRGKFEFKNLVNIVKSILLRKIANSKMEQHSLFLYVWENIGSMVA